MKLATLRGESNLQGHKMNLQLFADEGEQTEPEEEQQQEEVKTYTQEEVDKLLQQEGDKRVSTARQKIEKEFSERLKKELKEKERLATLSAEEKEKELIKQQQEALAEKERAIHLRELQLDTVNLLAEEKIPLGFANFLIKGDAETTNENIKSFTEQYNKAIAEGIEEGVKAALSGKSPKVSTTGNTMTKEEILNIKDAAVRIKAIQDNPQLFKN